ncbi:MAG: hypothetical protein M3O09_04480 [Acidobacteriota bacterium]|jgi:ABC-type transporter Mla subunit MlaD|nr:hypothetical protein [Acidobacteriota bacterium]
MEQEMSQQLMSTAERLASAAETLDRVLEKLDAQQEALNAKVDRIVAAVEERIESGNEGRFSARPDNQAELEKRVADLEKTNHDLKAQASRLVRKTLPPLVTALLSKSSHEGGEKLNAGALDKTLQSLSIDQRIAVKAEMARAGMID